MMKNKQNEEKKQAARRRISAAIEARKQAGWKRADEAYAKQNKQNSCVCECGQTVAQLPYVHSASDRHLIMAVSA